MTIVEHLLDGRKDPLIYALIEVVRDIYLVLKGAGTDETKFVEQIVRLIIFSVAERCRETFMADQRLDACMETMALHDDDDDDESYLKEEVISSDGSSMDDEASLVSEEMSMGSYCDIGPETKRKTTTVDKTRILFTMEGKGEPLEARMNSFKMGGSFPQNSSQMKYGNAGSAIWAFNDCFDLHSNLKSNVAGDKDCICQGDEARLPSYMVKVDTMFEAIGMKLSRQHTYFWCIANFEHWVESAVGYSVLHEGIKLSGIWPFSLWQFLSRFAGQSGLNQEDFDVIVNHFPYLVDVAHQKGYIDPLFVETMLKNFILPLCITSRCQGQLWNC
jgi:hypothetical protein